jgi:hypothetical protein
VAGGWWAAADASSAEPETANAIRSHAAGLYAAALDGLTDPLDIEIAKKRSADAVLPTSAGLDRLPKGYAARCDPERRAALVESGGGSKESEAAVDAALKWLINHQLPDGGWSIDLAACPNCNGKCSNSGRNGDDRSAATALALLPFLGRGYTHKDGPYKRELEKGIGFLAALAARGNGKTYDRGTMYSQGLAGIALAEAYGMTKDRRLGPPTQLALNYIMEAQDPRSGSWGYAPKQTGDTSITGWNLVALLTGADAKLQANPAVVTKVSQFLDAVQLEGGAAYCYRADFRRITSGPTAIGLLCRLRLGWKADHPGIKQGAAAIAARGPSRDIYRDYYANQVMYRVGGQTWADWNRKLHDAVVRGQDKAGHQAGSWYDSLTEGMSDDVGGRLFCTSLAALVLENYYRSPPER